MADPGERETCTPREEISGGTFSTEAGLGQDGTLQEPGDREALLLLVEERLALSKRRVAADTVRVETRTTSREEMAEIELERYRVEVTRVQIDRQIDTAPLARTNGDTTIIPIVEERLVMVKQLFLREELHIRHIVERDVRREAVTLRRQHATVARRGADETGEDGAGPVQKSP